MANPEFSAGKTVFILAVVVGCFAILWPKVFYPMMQAAFTMTKPRLNDEQVCCDVIYESKIDLKFFAELCKSVIDREMATNAGIRKYRRERYPPPGMMERCRKKIQELCNIDVSEALVKSKKGKFSIDLRKTSGNETADDQTPQLNLTECLEKHFQFSRPLPRRIKKERALPTHIKQERPNYIGPQVPHSALTKKGSPFHSTGPPHSGMPTPGKPHSMGSMRPSLGGPGKTGPSSKGGGAMGFIMPIYTVGIVVFFLYTITKVLFRKPEDQTPKVMDFHMDPEYRKYVLSEEYENGIPLSYKDYLKRREKEEYNKKAKLLGDKGRKQVFTAIEGIIAEMDDFRDKLMAGQNRTSFDKEDESLGVSISEEESRTRSEMDGAETEEEVEVDQLSGGGEEVAEPQKDQEAHSAAKPEEPLNELAEQLKFITEDSKIAVLGMETQAEFHERTPQPDEPGEISNIMLETSVSSDAQLLVAESQCLTHTSTDRIEGWSDYEDQPVVVTGKMTISLLGNKEASVHSTESKTSKRPVGPVKLEPENEDKKMTDDVSNQRRQIEELANALVEDILHNQVPKYLESARGEGSTPDMDTFEVLPKSGTEPQKEFSSKSRISPSRRQFSRESMNSQGSSFEYVSACQDEPPTPKLVERPRFSLSPSSGSDTNGNAGNQAGDFELINGGANRLNIRQNGSSPASFEWLSTGSPSPLLSPEYESSFEKVQVPEQGQDQDRTMQWGLNDAGSTPDPENRVAVEKCHGQTQSSEQLEEHCRTEVEDLGQFGQSCPESAETILSEAAQNSATVYGIEEDANDRISATRSGERKLLSDGSEILRLSTEDNLTEDFPRDSAFVPDSFLELHRGASIDEILPPSESIGECRESLERVGAPAVDAACPSSRDPGSDQSLAESVVNVTAVHRPDPENEQCADNEHCVPQSEHVVTSQNETENSIQ